MRWRLRSRCFPDATKEGSKVKQALLPYSHQADTRMRSHRLLQLDDNKSASSCQQAWCKLIDPTFYPQARFKMFSKLVANPIFPDLTQPGEANRPD